MWSHQSRRAIETCCEFGLTNCFGKPAGPNCRSTSRIDFLMWIHSYLLTLFSRLRRPEPGGFSDPMISVFSCGLVLATAVAEVNGHSSQGDLVRAAIEKPPDPVTVTRGSGSWENTGALLAIECSIGAVQGWDINTTSMEPSQIRSRSNPSQCVTSFEGKVYPTRTATCCDDCPHQRFTFKGGQIASVATGGGPNPHELCLDVYHGTGPNVGFLECVNETKLRCSRTIRPRGSSTRQRRRLRRIA